MALFFFGPSSILRNGVLAFLFSLVHRTYLSGSWTVFIPTSTQADEQGHIIRPPRCSAPSHIMQLQVRFLDHGVVLRSDRCSMECFHSARIHVSKRSITDHIFQIETTVGMHLRRPRRADFRFRSLQCRLQMDFLSVRNFFFAAIALMYL